MICMYANSFLHLLDFFASTDCVVMDCCLCVSGLLCVCFIG